MNDSDSLLLRHRIVWLAEPITARASNRVVGQLLHLNAESPDRPIEFSINRVASRSFPWARKSTSAEETLTPTSRRPSNPRLKQIRVRINPKTYDSERAN